MRFAGWCGLVVGALMFAQWVVFLASDSVPEVHTEPTALGFHLAAEGATAAALIGAGLLLLKGRRFGIVLGLVANGMLVYTVVVSPGYFAQRGDWALVAMFAVVLILALASIAMLAGGLRRSADSETSAAERPGLPASTSSPPRTGERL